MRRIRTRTNLSRCPKPLELQAADPAREGGDEELLYFRIYDPTAGRSPTAYLKPREAISTTELARRLAGVADIQVALGQLDC